MKKTLLIIVLLFAFGSIFKAQCLCGTTASENRWDGIGFKINDEPVKKYPCGYQLTVKTTAKITFISGGYLCIDKHGCKAQISAKLMNGTTLVQTYNPFNFTETIQFPTAGNYKLVLSAKCGVKNCKTCTYYFKVL